MAPKRDLILNMEEPLTFDINRHVFKVNTKHIIENFIFAEKEPTNERSYHSRAFPVADIVDKIWELINNKNDVTFCEEVQKVKADWFMSGTENHLAWLTIQYKKCLNELRDEPLLAVFNKLNVFLAAARSLKWNSKTAKSSKTWPLSRLSNKLGWEIKDFTAEYINTHHYETTFEGFEWRSIVDIAPDFIKIRPLPFIPNAVDGDVQMSQDQNPEEIDTQCPSQIPSFTSTYC